MSVIGTIYNYDAKINFTTHVQVKFDSIVGGQPPVPTNAQMQTALQNSVSVTVNQKVAEGFGKISGHWFRVNSTDVTVNSVTPTLPSSSVYQIYSVSGFTVTHFDSDVSDPNLGLSPDSIWTIIVGVLLIIVGVFVPAFGVIVIITGVAIVLAGVFQDFTGSIESIIVTGSQNIYSFVVVAVVILAGILLVLYFLTPKAGRSQLAGGTGSILKRIGGSGKGKGKK